MALKRNKDGKYYLDDEEEIKRHSAKNRQLYFKPTAEEQNAFQAKQRQEQKRIQQQSQAVKKATDVSANAIRGVSSRLTPARVTTMDDLSAKEHEDQMSAAALSNRVTYADVYKPKKKPPVVLPVVKQREQLDNVFKRGMTIDQMNALDHDNQMSAAALSNRVTAADVARKPIVPTREVPSRPGAMAYTGEQFVQGAKDAGRGILNAGRSEVASNLDVKKTTQNPLVKWIGDLLGVSDKDFDQKTVQELEERQESIEQSMLNSRKKSEGEQSALETKYAHLSEDSKKAGKFIGNTTGRIFPTMAVSALNPFMGVEMLYGTTAGDASTEALAAGTDIHTANRYGAAEGIKEVAIEKAFGGIPFLGDGAERVVGNLAKTPLGKALTTRLAGMVGEGAEEVASTLLTPYLKRFYYDPNAPLPSAGELLNSFTGGAVTSGLLNAPFDVAKGINYYKNGGKQPVSLPVAKKKTLDEYVDYAVEYGKTEGSIPKQVEFYEYSPVSREEGNRIKAATGIDVTGYTHALRDNDIRHLLKSPGVTVDDIKAIPDTVSSPDLVFKGKNTKSGEGKAFPDKATIYYVKRYNGTTHYLEQVLDEQGILVPKQMKKIPTGSVPKWIDKLPLPETEKQAIKQKITELSSSQRTDVPVNTVPREHVQDAMSNFDNSVTYSIPENSGKIKELPVAQRPEPVPLPVAEKKQPVTLPIAGKREQYSNAVGIPDTEMTEFAGAPTIEDAKAAYKQAEPVRRDIAYLESLDNLTEEQEAQLAQLQKQEKVLTAPAKKYFAESREALRSEMGQLVEGADSWKDKTMGYQYKRETPERIIRDIVPNETESGEINKRLFQPIHEHEADSIRWKTKYSDRVEELKIGTKKQYEAIVPDGYKLPVKKKVSERELVQLYGEHKITAEQLKQTGADVPKIQRAVEELRSIYNEILPQMNDALVRNGYEPILYRKDYFPHFTETRPDGVLAKIANVFGIEVQSDKLPTKIAGRTGTFKPGKRWFANALHRTTDVTEYDAVKGFDRYLDGVSDVIFHTDDIRKLRAFNEAIRDKFSDKGVQKKIKRVMNDDTLTEMEKLTEADRLKQTDTTALPKFVTWLDDYTNVLAGKKSLGDRNLEHNLGRGIYNASKALETRVAANMVAVNPASWITNFIPITQASSAVKTKNLVLGMKDQLASYIKPDNLFEESDFLTNRRGYDTLSKTTTQKIADKLTSPMKWIDEFTAGTIERARIRENITDKGMSWKEAVTDADQFTAGLMADRSKGALPTIFYEKSPLTKIFTMFQVETNNQLSYLFKDLPRELKDKGIKGIAWGLTKLFAGAFVYNAIYEMLTGRRAALDPIDIIIDAYGDFTDEDTTKSQAVLNTTWNIAEQLPFIGGVLEGGRVPIQSALPDFENVVRAGIGVASGEMPQNKAWSTLGAEAIKPLTYLALPFGGGQVKKMAESAFTIGQGGNYTLDSDGRKRLRFPATNLSPWNYVQAAAFGQYSLPGARDYVKSEFKSLSANDTEKYQEAIKSGMNSQVFLDTLKEFKKINADKDENGETTVSRQDKRREYLLKNKTLTPEQKAWWDKAFISEKHPASYTSLEDFYVSTSPESRQEEIRSLLRLGVSTDQIDRVAEKYSEIQDKYEGQKGSARSSATEFSKWLDEQGFTQSQREVINETYRYWAMTPAESEPYNEATLSEEGKELYSYDSVKNAVGGIDNFIQVQEILNETKGDKDEYGNTISGTAKHNQIAAISNKLQISTRQAENIYNELRVYKHSLDDLSSSARKRYEVAAAHDMSAERFLKFYNLYLTVEGNKDANGKTIRGSKERNAIYIFMQNGLSRKQAGYFYKILTTEQ